MKALDREKYKIDDSELNTLQRWAQYCSNIGKKSDYILETQSTEIIKSLNKKKLEYELSLEEKVILNVEI